MKKVYIPAQLSVINISTKNFITASDENGVIELGELSFDNMLS